MIVRISAPIYPSEDPEKVKDAVLRIFPTAILEISEKGVDGTSEDLDNFRIQIRKQKILDTARSVMLKGQTEGRTTFRMNKQVASVGKISFTEERTILGSIKATVEDDDIFQLIDDIAPNTVDGEEIK